MNCDMYLDDDYLSLGSRHLNRREKRPAVYCMYSGDREVMNLRLNPRTIKNVYHKDVVKISRDGAYMGIWQFHQGAEVVKCPLGTVYPQNTNDFVRADMNRIILPSNRNWHEKDPMHVMWTPMSKKDKTFEVRHFVPLFKPMPL